MRTDVKDLSGVEFGYLKAIFPYSENGRTKWLCSCVCGSEYGVRSDALQSGKTKSCGCMRGKMISKSQTLPEGEAHRRIAYHFYKKSAKDRGLEFSLDKVTFDKITSSPCIYCGKKPDVKNAPYSTVSRIKTFAAIVGIDRVDPKKGYTKENCAPCCSQCNQIKMDMSLPDFLNKVRDIFNNMRLKDE